MSSQVSIYIEYYLGILGTVNKRVVNTSPKIPPLDCGVVVKDDGEYNDRLVSNHILLLLGHCQWQDNSL